MIGTCEGCSEQTVLIPLHGGKGGPVRCPICVGKWNAEHGRRRRTGRVVIRAIKAFLDAGGKYTDIDKLKLSASCDDVLADLRIDPLGYMADIAHLDAADVDLTSELLADALRLTHPDCHPPERQELAHRVTQGLLALQPFVFPAPKPKPVEPPWKNERGADSTSKSTKSETSGKQPAYPCADCADAMPSEYCDACSAEYERREQKKFEQRTAKQREQYARRRRRILARRASAVCEVCGREFKSKRNDAHFCSARCRQRAHRKRGVTAKHSLRPRRLSSRDLQRAVLALVRKHRAVYLNDILPAGRTRAQYQALSLAAARLEAAGEIETVSYWARWDYPGHKVLLRPGYEIKDRKVHLLKDDERVVPVRN
jgi:hypothetical protein